MKISQVIFVGGPFPASSLIASILPGFAFLDWPVKLPSLREGDRYFWAAPVSHKKRSNVVPAAFRTQTSWSR
jgi:hypothetical protein